MTCMTTTTYQALTITRVEEHLLRTGADRARQAREAAAAARLESRCRRALRTLAALEPLRMVRRSSVSRFQAAACGC